jgi:hypothetical protein
MKNIFFILAILVSSIGFSQDSISNFAEFAFVNSKVNGNTENGSSISLGTKFKKYSISVSYANYKSLSSLELVNQYDLVQKKNFRFGPSLGIGYTESCLTIDQNSFFFNHNHIGINKSPVITPAVNFYLYGILNLSVKYRLASDNVNSNGVIYSIGMKFNIK